MHMIDAGLPAARPVPFPNSGSTLQKLKWLEREIEHTAAPAEHQGKIDIKLKALHALSRSPWLEVRLTRGALDVTPDDLPNDRSGSDQVMYGHYTGRRDRAHMDLNSPVGGAG